MAENPVWYDASDAETVKAWEQELDVEIRFKAPKVDPAYGLIGKEDTKPFQEKDKLTQQNQAGDRITFTLRWQLSASNKMKVGNQVQEGSYLGFETSTFNLSINQLRQAARTNGRMAQQRVLFNIIEQNKSALADYLADQTELGMSVHLGGWAPVTEAAWNWNNTPNAPDANHIRRVNGRATDQALVEADKLNRHEIDRVIAMSKQVRPRMRPAVIHGQKLFLMLMHSNVVMHMRDSDSDFFLIHLKAIEGGRINDNPIITGALGVYNGTLFVEDQWTPPGLHSTANTPVANTRRNPFCGAGSLALGFGKVEMPGGYHPNKWLWYTDDEDGGDKVACYASTIAGIAAPRYTIPGGSAVDYGKIVLSSYAEDVTGQEEIWTDILAA